MKKIVVLMLSILLIGIFLPGCTQKEEPNDCQSLVEEQREQNENLQVQIEGLKNQVFSLNSTLQAKDAQLQEIINQKQEEEKKPTAKVEIKVVPNPVVCEKGICSWMLEIEETNGIGIKLERITNIYYSEVNSGQDILTNIEELFGLKDAYFPAYGKASAGRFGLNSNESVKYIRILLQGTDDNGNEIKVISEEFVFEGTDEIEWLEDYKKNPAEL
jgi:hypothetical protein